MLPITSFTGEYEFLSMTYNHPITVDGLEYTNAESAFWAQRVKDKYARSKYTRLSGNKARAKAIQAEPVETWEEDKDDIMKMILAKKFEDPVLKKKLLSTGKAKLKNVNTYRDDYWGIYNTKGKNKLGRFLEELRDSMVTED